MVTIISVSTSVTASANVTVSINAIPVNPCTISALPDGCADRLVYEHLGKFISMLPSSPESIVMTIASVVGPVSCTPQAPPQYFLYSVSSSNHKSPLILTSLAPTGIRQGYLLPIPFPAGASGLLATAIVNDFTLQL